MRDIVTEMESFEVGLCKTKVLATRGDSSENLLAKGLIAFVLGEIKL
jgi:hypothetical protein